MAILDYTTAEQEPIDGNEPLDLIAAGWDTACMVLGNPEAHNATVPIGGSALVHYAEGFASAYHAAGVIVIEGDTDNG